MRLVFDRGALVLHGNPADAGSLPGVLWDPRVQAWRAPACYYGTLCQALSRRYPGFHDEARPKLVDAPPIPFPALRPYQAAAVASWEFAGKRGIIALPTGSGKTRAAIAAVSKTRLRTLCLVPTRALRMVPAAKGRRKHALAGTRPWTLTALLPPILAPAAISCEIKPRLEKHHR